MPDNKDRQREIDMQGKTRIPKLFNDIPAPFVVRNPMEAINLEMGPKPNTQWLSENAVRDFRFPNNNNRGN